MKKIMLALFLVLPFTYISAAEIGGWSAWERTGEAIYVYCNGCPEKSHNEKFVDDLWSEDVGVIVVWENDVPKRIIITSTSTAPVQDVCDTFKRYYPNLTTTIVTHIGSIRTYRCAESSVGGPASLEVADK
jgi:hypothetical protein